MSVTPGFVEAWTGTGRHKTGYFAARSCDTFVGTGPPSFRGGQVASRLASDRSARGFVRSLQPVPAGSVRRRRNAAPLSTTGDFRPTF